MSPAWLAAIGALLSGGSSAVAAFLSVRIAQKRAVSECDRRVKELQRTFDRGVAFRKKLEDEEHDERWSGLP